MTLVKCPFCGDLHSCGEVLTVGVRDAVYNLCIVSIECPCGATWATEHGGRHYVGKRERAE